LITAIAAVRATGRRQWNACSPAHTGVWNVILTDERLGSSPTADGFPKFGEATAAERSRSLALGSAIASFVCTVKCTCNRQTGNGRGMASSRISSVLGLEEPPLPTMPDNAQPPGQVPKLLISEHQSYASE